MNTIGAGRLLRLMLHNGYALVAYVAAGYVGLKLASGLIEASLIWPAAGIALGGLYLFGMRLVPGFFAGMLAVSFLQQFADGYSDHGLAISVMLSVNALLQAAVGAFVLRRHFGPDATLVAAREVTGFFALAVASCLIAPSLGVLVLFQAGTIPPDALDQTWITWWLGDALGVMIFTPIVVATFGRVKSIWRPRRRSVALPTLVLLGLVSTFYWYSNGQENRRLQLLFARQSQGLEGRITQGLAAAGELSVVLKALFDSNRDVSEDQFNQFVAPLLERHPSVQALEWIPRVSHDERRRSDAAPEPWLPPIREPDAQRNMVSASVRREYYPIVYLQPLAGNERAKGFDVTTNQTVHQALGVGAHTGRTVSSGPIQLIQDQAVSHGFVIYAPVFSSAQMAADPDHLLGFVAVVLRVQPLIDSLLTIPDRSLVDLAILDGAVEIFSSSAGQHPSGPGRLFASERAFAVADRTWLIKTWPNHEFFSVNYRWGSASMHAFGFAFTGLMAAMLLIITGRSVIIERVVERRTFELKEEVGRRIAVIRHLDAHNDVLRRMTEQETPLRDLLGEIAETACSIISESTCVIFLEDPSGDHLRLVASYGLPEVLADRWTHRAEQQPSSASGQTSTVRALHPLDRLARRAGLVVGWSQTIRSASGEAKGRVEWYSGNRDVDSDAVQGLLLDFAKLISLAIERREAEARIRRLAFSDSLTGLPNRESILGFLASEMVFCDKHGVVSAVLFIDVDDLKDVNDSLGHHYGDMLIREVATRLLGVCREGDMAARIGGDEFVVVLAARASDPATMASAAIALFDRVTNALTQPIHLQGYNHLVTLSVGVTMISDVLCEPAELLEQADIAMYRAKQEGKNRICFYNPEMRAAAQHYFSVEKGLEDALSSGALVLYSQLQFDDERRPVAAEALLRWRHPDRGLLSAHEFVPVAEKSSLIVRLDAWVLERACQQIARQFTLDYLAVNISPRSLQRQDFVATVMTTVERSGIRPDQLALEITEHSLIENLQDNLGKLRELREAGLRIAVDDFGTGYSSLFYLRHLPLTQIKIDKVFISGILENANDAFIVSSVIRLASQMNLELVAEGVETEAQMQALLEAGCTRFQGYLLNRPDTAD